MLLFLYKYYFTKLFMEKDYNIKVIKLFQELKKKLRNIKKKGKLEKIQAEKVFLGKEMEEQFLIGIKLIKLENCIH